jgi:hypothetical protein
MILNVNMYLDKDGSVEVNIIDSKGRKVGGVYQYKDEYTADAKIQSLVRNLGGTQGRVRKFECNPRRKKMPCNPCHINKKEKVYMSNPLTRDLINSLNAINHVFNTFGRHVSIISENNKYTIQMTDEQMDILNLYGPMDYDSVNYVVLGILLAMKVVRYE